MAHTVKQYDAMMRERAQNTHMLQPRMELAVYSENRSMSQWVATVTDQTVYAVNVTTHAQATFLAHEALDFMTLTPEYTTAGVKGYQSLVFADRHDFARFTRAIQNVLGDSNAPEGARSRGFQTLRLIDFEASQSYPQILTSATDLLALKYYLPADRNQYVLESWSDLALLGTGSRHEQAIEAVKIAYKDTDRHAGMKRTEKYRSHASVLADRAEHGARSVVFGNSTKSSARTFKWLKSVEERATALTRTDLSLRDRNLLSGEVVKLNIRKSDSQTAEGIVSLPFKIKEQESVIVSVFDAEKLLIQFESKVSTLGVDADNVIATLKSAGRGPNGLAHQRAARDMAGYAWYMSAKPFEGRTRAHKSAKTNHWEQGTATRVKGAVVPVDVIAAGMPPR